MLQVHELPDGAIGFDCNSPLTADHARTFRSAGYSFAVRYIGRESPLPQDLSPREMSNLTSAGLGVMLVQHVERDNPPWWTPNDTKGREYGDNAVVQARALDYPSGAVIWLDLEGVVPHTDAEVVIRYANYWYDRVAKAGYLPGVYVGYGTQLWPDALYRRLKFALYWGALNLDVDQYPAIRGICMKQHASASPRGIPFRIDRNVVNKDRLGGLPRCALFAEPVRAD